MNRPKALFIVIAFTNLVTENIGKSFKYNTPTECKKKKKNLTLFKQLSNLTWDCNYMEKVFVNKRVVTELPRNTEENNILNGQRIVVKYNSKDLENK